MTNRRSSLALALIFIAAMIGFTGCDNNPNPDPLFTERPDGSPWIVSYRTLPEDPRSLDPQYSYDSLGNVIISQVFESLFQYSLYKTDPYELEPCLAESMPTKIQNPDGTESFEFRIKKGIRFHDDPCFPGGKGRELTSADFVYTFQRLADPKVESPVLSTLQEFIAGLKPAFEEAVAAKKFDYSKPTGAITVIDDYTFRINLLKPYPQLFYWLAMPFTTPVAKEAIEYYDGKNGRDLYKFHPVGTGPYRLAQWQRQRMMRMERNPHYITVRFPESGWPAKDDARLAPYAGKPLPFIDEVQFNIIKEAIPAWLLFRQGYIDRSGVGKDVFNSVITSNFTLSEEFAKRGVTLYKEVGAGSYYLQFNMADPLIGENKKLRQALSMALDFNRENELFFNGIFVKSEQLLPPGVIGYDPSFKNPNREFNVAKAKALLAEAGYPNGIDPKTGKPLSLVLDVISTSAGDRQHSEFYQNQFEQIGVKVKIEENTWARFQDKMHRGGFQMNSGSGWSADYPDPENFFFLFYSKNIPPAGNNYTHFKNEEFDTLFEKMSTMENGPERLALIRRMTEILADETPIVFGSHPVSLALSQPWIPLVASNSMLGTGGLMKYQMIDSELRKEKRKEWNVAPAWPLWVLGFAIVGLGTYVALWARKRNL